MRRTLSSSFRNAIAGIVYCFRTERNMLIHLFAAAIVFLFAWQMHLNKYEWILLVLTVVAVISAEMFNTAVERMVDLISPQVHPLAKAAKDIAAGAVLITAMAALAVGYLLFLCK